MVVGTEGERGIDISKLRAQTGAVTLDNGFVNTASCESAITFIDGEAGHPPLPRHPHRGAGVGPGARRSSRRRTCSSTASSPPAPQLDEFRFGIRKHTLLHEDAKRFFDGFPKDAHPMGTLSSVVSALSTFYQDSNDPHDPDQVQLSILRLMAKLPTIAAYAYKKSIGQPFLYPDNSLDLVENFLTMMFAVPSERYEVSHNTVVTPQAAADPARRPRAELLHQHRAPGRLERGEPLRRRSPPGINALWGPLHGGANQAVIEMLDRIAADGGDVDKYVRMAKDPDDPFRLSGFGHRVYKNYDPRARILKDAATGVIAELGTMDQQLDLALRLEEVALSDEYFVERKLYPNVDFYSGLIYRAMGFPTQMFPVLFAMGRLPGWIAHWVEMMESPATKIGRPRQIYTGATKRPYVPIDERG